MSEGPVTTTQVVHGATLGIIEKKARQRLRAYFAHHAYDVIEIRARPQTTLGGEVVHWTAEVTARMRSKTASA